MEFEKSGITLKIDLKSFGIGDAQSFNQENIPKLIFKDARFRNISYNGMEFSEHELKRRFKGQSHVTFGIIQTFTESGSMKLEIASEGDNDYNALALVSKRDIRTKYPQLKLANKELVYDQAKRECIQYLNEYENILNGNIFSVEILDSYNDDKIGSIEILLSNKEDFVSKVLTILGNVGWRTENALMELSNQDEFKKMFDRFDNRIEF